MYNYNSFIIRKLNKEYTVDYTQFKTRNWNWSKRVFFLVSQLYKTFLYYFGFLRIENCFINANMNF